MPRFDHNLNFDESNLEDYEFEEAEARTEAYKETAKGKIEGLLDEYRIVWPTLVEVILEKEHYPWISRGALLKMYDEGSIRIFRHVGRPSRQEKTLPSFYYDSSLRKSDVEEKYDEARSLWLKLYKPQDYGLPDYARWAEDIVLKMFLDNGGRLIKRPIPKLNGSSGGDNDFLISYGGLHYSVEVKNIFRTLEVESDIRFKFGVARSNDHEFLFVPRFLNSRHAYTEVIAKGGYVLMFKWMAFPPGAEDFVSDLEGWGLPVSVWDTLPKSVWSRFDNEIHPKAAEKRISRISKRVSKTSLDV